MKKRILSAFLVLCMMLTMVPTAALAAEDPGGGNGSDRVHTESNDGVVVDKTVNYDEDGNYSLTLEAYVTNEVTKGSKTTPLDIVLVLDLSGSMDQNITSYTYEATSKRNWSYNDIDRQSQYYYFDGTSYYAVQRERSDPGIGIGTNLNLSGIIRSTTWTIVVAVITLVMRPEPECRNS